MAVPLALLAATRRSPVVPDVFPATTAVMLAIPAFLTAPLALIVFGLHWRIRRSPATRPASPAT